MVKPWWKQTVFYEVYMPSFSDGNGDGIGDFIGLTSKLDYLQDLGVRGIWLTPFYTSPKVDNGYDIADYCQVDPDFGTMDDFERFIREAKVRGIHVIADLVLNHTSSEHAWFKESRVSRTNPKRDWYIWKDAVDGGVPNNWESFFGGTAWEWDAATEQYYYHGFAKEQVDLNWANPEVNEAMKEVMAFWLDKGVNGFRLDVINFLSVSNQFPDNPMDEATGEQKHVNDQDQDGILEVIQEISEFVHARSGMFMVGEVGSEDMNLLKHYSGDGKLDVVFNFNLGSQKEFSPENLFAELETMERVHREDQIPTLFFGSHDMARVISRFGEGDMEIDTKRARLMATLALTAKGVPFLYFGEEIGMRNFVAHRLEDMRDVQGLNAYDIAVNHGKTPAEALEIANAKGRDASRSPMQWNAGPHGGFTTGTPWIGMGPNYQQWNVESEWSQPDSLLHYYKRLLHLRNTLEVFQFGDYTVLERRGNLILYVRTWKETNSSALVALNYDKQSVQIDPRALLGGEATCLLSSCRETVNGIDSVNLLPNEAVIWMRV
ncbi:glucohydrolase [Paenibacillus selenitireducens]|uniref:Glucohydrolase n=1 Tax=Paenibacillus selenitireducens TaxID=1324314 RepID=A0A1T2XKZ5_9BACL|nr:alpha-glucosidase [Paenibacillus selenitireducens]OPA80396.1 glucohydrolase [Paenibacillus selenitireducens]